MYIAWRYGQLPPPQSPRGPGLKQRWKGHSKRCLKIRWNQNSISRKILANFARVLLLCRFNLMSCGKTECMQWICHRNICNFLRVNFIEWSRDCSKHANPSFNLHLVAILMPPLQQGLRRGPEMMTYLRPVQSKLAKLINFASCCLTWRAASVHGNFPKIQQPLWSHR